MAHVSNSRAILLAAGSALILSLSACESTGTLRVADVGSVSGSGDGGATGDAGGSGSGDSGNGSGTGSGNGGSTGGSGSGGGSTGGTGGSGSGAGSGGSGGSGGTGGQALAPVLVTAGNAVLAVNSGAGGVVTPVATAVPLTAPITGAITRVLGDSGKVLVDAGNGRTLLVEGIKGVVGDVVTIRVGERTLITGLDGTPGAVGLGALGSAQPLGTVASLGVLNAGTALFAQVNGIARVKVTNVSIAPGLVSTQLLSVALGGTQLLGQPGQAAVISAALLPSGLPAPAAVLAQLPGGGLTPTLAGAAGAGGGATLTSGVVAPVGAAAGAVLGGSGSASVAGVPVAVPALASTPNAIVPGSVAAVPAVAPVLQTVTGTASTLKGAIKPRIGR